MSACRFAKWLVNVSPFTASNHLHFCQVGWLNLKNIAMSVVKHFDHSLPGPLSENGSALFHSAGSSFITIEAVQRDVLAS